MQKTMLAITAIIRELIAKASSSSSVSQVVSSFEPLLISAYRDGLLKEWLEAASETARPIKESLPMVGGLPPLRPPFNSSTGSLFDPEPVVRLPLIEIAANDLYSRQILTPEDFAELDQDARRTAFTVIRNQSLETMAKIRDELAANIQNGGTLADFRDRIGDVIGQSALSPSSIETTYRTQAAQAYSAGQRAVLSNPLVFDEFPYLMWSATHDSRVRPDHLEMEKHGQNGTAIYRADDPIWETLYPPAGYNCRCVLIPLSIEDAARYGSTEAREWLASGIPPIRPDWAKQPYPIVPPPNWPTHRRIESVI